MKTSVLFSAVGLTVLVLVLFLAGCASSTVVEKSDDELLAMEQEAAAAFNDFKGGRYAAAEKKLLALGRERTVNQPLYQCELAVVYLAMGDDEKAFQQLREAQISVESFFDEASEKEAASLWGSEAQKVYKGEAYERSTLYLLLGLMFMERDDVDSALACFKSGLLCDSDVEKNRYNSDYGLLQLLAAKCFGLRDEPEMKRQYMKLAVKSFLHTHPDLQTAVEAMLDAQALPASGSVAPIVARLQRRYGDAAANLRSSNDVVAFCTTELQKVLDLGYYQRLTEGFNTLVVVWAGTAPEFSRSGRYGETRVVRPGTLDLSQYAVIGEVGANDALRGFACMGYQATTRGGRVMDNVLEGQADFKETTSDLGDALIQSADDAGGYVGAGMAIFGLVAKGLSSATTVEADIRAWKTLPNELQVVPMNLPDGVHQMSLCVYCNVTPLAEMPFEFTVDSTLPLNVVYIFPRDLGQAEIPARLGKSTEQDAWFSMAKSGYYSADTDRDGEISALEMKNAHACLLRDFDVDKNGALDAAEWATINKRTSAAFQGGMVQK